MSSKNRFGKNRISEEDLTGFIAEVAAETEGVSELFTGITGNITRNILGRESDPARGVKIVSRKDRLYIDIYIIAKYKAEIPDLAWEIQTRVREKVQELADSTVEEINIHVQGVSL